MLSHAAAIIKRSITAMERFSVKGLPEAVRAAEAIADVFAAGGKLYCFGNGGSAADAQHLAAEFINRFQLERPPLPAVALTTDTSALTAIANDYDYEEIFRKQIKGLGAAGDVAFGITTSGSSPNVLKGLAAAKERGMITIGMCGKDAPELAHLCEYLISAPAEETARVQEVHQVVLHIICELVDLKLFGRAR